MYGNIIPNNYEELIKIVDEEAIYNHYYGDFLLNKFYHSPFRQEKNPSFKFSYYQGRLVWRDFGISQNPRNCIEFVAHLYEISYKDAIEKIMYDIVFNNTITIKPSYKKKNQEINPNKTVCIYRKINGIYLNYWNQVGVTEDKLGFYNIYICDIYFNNIRILNSNKYPIYLYLFDKERKIWKAYNPYHKQNRMPHFYSHNIQGHIQNYENIGLTGSDILIITKSYKDCIMLNMAGYDAIAPHAETVFISENKLNDLKDRYSQIFILFDNDSCGIQNSEYFSKKYNIPNIFLPKNDYQIKDCYDVVLNYGIEYLKNLINNIIYDWIIKKPEH